MALSKVPAPGNALTGRPAASVRNCAWTMPSSGTGPVPIRPFSDWKNTCMPGGTWLATSVGNADAQVHQHAVAQFEGDALGDHGLCVHGVTRGR